MNHSTEPDWDSIFAATLLMVGPPPKRIGNVGHGDFITGDYQRWLQQAWHYCWQQVPEKHELTVYNSIFERQRQAADVRDRFEQWIQEKLQQL